MEGRMGRWDRWKKDAKRESQSSQSGRRRLGHHLLPLWATARTANPRKPVRGCALWVGETLSSSSPGGASMLPSFCSPRYHSESGMGGKSWDPGEPVTRSRARTSLLRCFLGLAARSRYFHGLHAPSRRTCRSISLHFPVSHPRTASGVGYLELRASQSAQAVRLLDVIRGLTSRR